MPGSPCRNCKAPLAYTFLTYGNPIEGPRSFGELGRGHSEIIAPKQFIDEILLLDPTIDADPASLELTRWRTNRDTHTRVQTCLAELAKFIPAGAESIPAECIPPGDLFDLFARSECYRLDWVTALLERHQQISNAIIADLPRINAIEKQRSKKRPKGINYLDRDALISHDGWVGRGAKGKGRLVLIDAVHTGMNLGRGVELSGAHLIDVDLAEARMADASLNNAELENVSFAGGNLASSLFHGATLAGGSFEHAGLCQCEFTNARITGANFTGADLDESLWAGAHVEAARFVETRFANANLDGATFSNCDLRQADLSAADSPSTRARFEHCDLRDTNWEGRNLTGVTFVECRLEGAQGLPAAAWKHPDHALMPLAEALLQPWSRIAAWDRSSEGEGKLRIVAYDNEQAAVIARGPVPADARPELEQHLVRNGILLGATCRACSVYWVIDDTRCLIVTHEAGITMSLSGSTLLAAGQTISRDTIRAVRSFVDDADIGHRGVQLELQNGTEVFVAEEHDLSPEFDPTYDRMNLEIDAGWIVHLGRELAQFLQVPHHDELWG